MDEPDEQSNLPESLEGQFEDLELALFRKETSLVVMGAICTVLVSIAILFVSDRFWDSPTGLRGALLIAAALGVAGCAVVWLRNWRWDPRGLGSLAKMIQFHHRRFGDRLRGAVELAAGDVNQPRMSPALRRAAIQQVAEGAREFDFTSVIDDTLVRRLKVFFLILLVATIGTSLAAPPAAWNSFVRWLMPTSEIERFTFVSISDLPEEMIVLHGGEFSAQAGVKYRGLWKPDRATIQFEEQPPIEVTVNAGMIRVDLPGQTRAGTLKVKLGDAQASAMILPTHPPAVQKLEAVVTLPKYLQYPVTNLTFSGPGLTVVEESTMKLRAEANRELASVRFWSEGTEALDLPISGNVFETPELQPFGELQGLFSIGDQLGLTNTAPRPFFIRTRPDEQPVVELLDLAPSLSILETDVLELRLFASDDFGIKLAGIAWKLVEGETNTLGLREMKSELTNTTTIEFTNSYIFSPTVLGIPADTTIELRAAALDYYPDREPAQSSSYRIRVIGNVRHAMMVKEQLEALFAEVEEITRTEEAIAQATSELKNKPGEQADGDADSKEAQKLAEQQEQNNRHLESIARTGQRILEEAIRNPVISEKALKEWTENISAMQRLAKQEMKKSAESLRDAQEAEAQAAPSKSSSQQASQQASPSPQSPQSPKSPKAPSQPQSQQKQELAKAEDAQQKALEQLQQMQKRINEGLDNLEALTLAERLRGLAMKEDVVVSQVRSVIVETLGLRPHELKERHHLMNGRLANDQRKIGKDSGEVQDEIGRFFDRTRKPVYGEVNREMKEAKTATELDEVGNLIGGNIAMETIQDLGRWMRRLNSWAEMLEPPAEDSKSGSGKAGEQQKQQKLIKMLLAFIRIRMNEVSLHQHTRMLDEDRTQKTFAQAAEKLSEQQRDIRQDFFKVQMENEHEVMKELFLDGQTALMDSEYGLREPETGKPTQDAQIASIRNLSDLINLINEEAKRGKKKPQNQSPQQQQAMEEMQMLLKLAQQQMKTAFSRMPGMKPGSSPGTGENGGGTGTAGNIPGGRNENGGPGDGSGNRASGRTRQIPAEFRQIMERYFKAVEKEL